MKKLIFVLLLISCSPKQFKGNEIEVEKQVKKERQAAIIAVTVFGIWYYLFTQYGE